MPFGWENFNYAYGHDGAIDNRYDNPFKQYVSVTARFEPDGRLIPLSIDWEDANGYEKSFDIEKIFNVARQASRKAGGAGWCYSIQVMGKRKELYLEVDKWFIIRKSY